MDVDAMEQTLAERRGRREHRLPKRYRDVLPDRPAALPPPPSDSVQPEPIVFPSSQGESLPQEIPPAETTGQGPSSVLSGVRQILKSARNIFGLFRQYHATRFPEHDPAENIASDDLIDAATDSPSSLTTDSYHPYPNQSSFLLGEWYWNDGAKKTQSNFKNLVKIVGHPDFRPEDVAGTKWQFIDAQLGGGLRDDKSDEGDGESGWEDDQVSGDWIETPIKINVPFHKRTLHPGTANFEVGKLHHRKLVSVIKEKILRPSGYPHLHLEPYELYWQPSEASEPVRVYGELFSSEAFIEANRDLQNSPGEPGCELAKVVVGLMFASDGTHLTAFSDAKLWPLYLAIGNESKDRRSKPSCHAFEHVAYFETVSITHSSLCNDALKSLIDSSPTPSRPLRQSASVRRDPRALFGRTVIEKLTKPSGRSSSMTNSWKRTRMVL
jgi:Plavaka transposase